MASYPLALRRALFRETWKRFAPSSDGLTRRHLDLLDGMLRSLRERSRIELPGGAVALLEREGSTGVSFTIKANCSFARGGPMIPRITSFSPGLEEECPR